MRLFVLGIGKCDVIGCGGCSLVVGIIKVFIYMVFVLKIFIVVMCVFFYGVVVLIEVDDFGDYVV